MKYEKYESLIQKVDAEINSANTTVNEIENNTHQAIMFLNTKMDYLKFKYAKSTLSLRHKSIIDYLTENFGKLDEAKINKVLYKNFIFKKSHMMFTAIMIMLISNIFVFKLLWDWLLSYHLGFAIAGSVVYLFIVPALSIACTIDILDSVMGLRFYRLRSPK